MTTEDIAAQEAAERESTPEAVAARKRYITMTTKSLDSDEIQSQE